MNNQNIPLKNKLKFWYVENTDVHGQQEYANSQQPIGLVDSVQSFWGYYQHMKRPSQLKWRNSLSIFQENIKPIWEDPANQKGGCFKLNFWRNKADQICENILLAYLIKNMEDCDFVNGIRFNIKKDRVVIQVWVRKADDQNNIEQTKDWIINSLCLNPDSVLELSPFQ